jgi:hypothetical protein
MTSTAAGDDAGRESCVRRVAMWLGHYEPRIAPVSNIVIFVFVLSVLWYPIQIAWVGTFMVLMVMNIGMMVCGDFAHGRNLCPRDIDDTLLDPQGAVDRNLRRLSWVHRRRVLGVIAPLTMIFLLTDVSRLAHLPWPFRAAATVVAIAASLGVVYSSLSMYTHQRLQPWCPWCRHGGHGPGSQVSVPDPQPVGTNVR